MSLVGPRPIVEAELAHYGAAREVLLTVKPGLTGAWAVEGRSRINYPERADIELEYATGWTITGDLRILARTVGVVLQRRGAY
jgi:exopolysaccharide production protein ExoY